MKIKWNCGNCAHEIIETVPMLPVDNKKCPKCGATMIYPPLMLTK